MFLPKNNLVAIAYKAGYCGSLVYALCAMSPEVQQFVKFNDLEFKNGTAHEVAEAWFVGLHNYEDSFTINEQDWSKYLTDRVRHALLQDGLILFRCHPNIAVKLSFIENLRVLYLTHRNKYVPERWAYEKVFRPQGDVYFQQDLQKLLGTQKNMVLNNRIRRTQLIKNLNHDVVSWQQVKDHMGVEPFFLEVDQLLEQNFGVYQRLCQYLQITPIDQDRFNNIIHRYNQKQWKRF